MKQPISTKQRFSSADRVKFVIVSIFLAMLLVIFGFLIGLLLRQQGFRLSMLVPQSQGTLDFAPTPITSTLVVPTQSCGSPTLVLGTKTFQIQTITPAADGSVTGPPDTSGIAYWVEGTNYVLVLSPTDENMAIMSTLTSGSTATVTLSSCDSNTYSLSAPQPSSLNGSASPDQSPDGITVFFETDVSGAGFMFTGELSEQEITTFNTPNPNELQAEIGLLETTTSADGATVKITVSVHNYGASPITISKTDVSLTQPDGTSLALKSSKPRLPEGIRPGETKTFELSFPRPSSSTATLKIFTVEYDIEGY